MKNVDLNGLKKSKGFSQIMNMNRKVVTLKSKIWRTEVLFET